MIATYAKRIPRTVTYGYLRVARLPLRAIERVAGQRDNSLWPPTMTFEQAEANVEALVGALIRDEDMTQSAEVRRAKLAKLREAAVLEAEAGRRRQQADETFESRRGKAEQRRTAAAQQAQRQKEQLEQQADKREQAAKQKAAKKTAAARKVKAQQDEVIERQERAAQLKALDAESEALATAKAAADTEATVDVIDDTIKGEKETRQTG